MFHSAIGTYKKLHYICLTEYNKEKLLHLKQIKESQIFIKPNFVTNTSEGLSQLDRKNQMIYVGRLEEIKGVDILLKAWKLLGEEAPELIMCGTGPMESWCREFVTENKLNKVRILGFVKNDLVREMIAQSKALILPTQVYEGFPMTVLEAMSEGTPVIGSNLGNVGTLIKDSVNGMRFEAHSAENLAEIVKTIDIDNQGVREYFEENYSQEANYKKIKEIYDKIVL